jgi:threonine synthase
VAVAKAVELGFDKICGASTGNAASSTACLCASIGLSPIIFVPESAPKAKIAQLLIFGAKVFAVKGSYDAAFDLCLEATAEYGWYNRNTGYNPYTREGKKSCSFEICEQLNWEVPDLVLVPVGDGNIISGIWKGFKDLHGVGLIQSLPALVAVQSEKSSAVANAVNGDGVIRPVKAATIADSISVDLPRDGDMAVRAVKESKGMAVTVSDEEILDTIPMLARTCGIFAEPAGATSVAGLRKLIADGKLSGSERVVCLITGNGLKDIDTAMKIAGKTISIEPELASLKKAIAAAGIE